MAEPSASIRRISRIVGRGPRRAELSQGHQPGWAEPGREAPPYFKIDERDWVNGGEWASLGEEVSLGDWDVVVTKVARNANEAIADADWDNDEPNGQFVLVTYQATYNGPDRSADVEEWTWWSFVGSDNVAYGESFEDTPLEAQGLYALDIGRGETVTDQALFDVPRHVIDGGAISLTAWDSDNEDKEYYTAFTF